MSQRFEYHSHPGIQALRALEAHIHGCGLEPLLLDLTLAIIAINSWNRLAISSRVEAGHYRPGSVK